MDSKEGRENSWMVAKDRHDIYREMGIGEGHSPAVRGETPRMRQADQSEAGAATNGLMMEVPSMLLMQHNGPPFLGLPPPEVGPKFDPGGRFKAEELSGEKLKTESDSKREMGLDKFNWGGGGFSYKDLSQLLARPQDVRPPDPVLGMRPLEEAELRHHLELEMDLIRARQAKRFETERRRELGRRNSTENPGKSAEMNGKLPDYMLPMSPPGKHLSRNLGPLNWASVASWFFRPEAGGPGAVTTASTTPNSARTPELPQFALAPTICTAIRCTVPGCTCECFSPGKLHIRYCEVCSHGWVPHALDKLGFRHLFGQSPVEPVQPNVAFDIASLVLYGCQALPIRLKILLDRLFSVLQREEVLQVLRGFGWTHEDYARGYILQEPHGAVLDRWNICSPDEEPLVLQQFLRFGETRAITQQLLLHGAGAPRLEADLHKFLERASARPQIKEEDHNSRISIKPIQQLQQTRRGLSPPAAPAPPTMGVQHHLGSSRPPPPPISPHQKTSSMNFLKLPPTGLTCTPATTSNGPVTSSPPSSISSSPISVSPLNRLQSMQPFDFRKIATGAPMKASPERRRTSETSEASPPGLMNLCVTSPNPVCPPPPPPHMPATSTAMSIYSGHRSPSGDPQGSSDFGSDDDDDDEENSHSALNLSRDAAPRLGRPPKPQHLRKTSTPMKRQWGSSALPLNLGTQLINPATGKKRVQCNVCLKTFCDKGALKIHFSAVHLREMHKCTVEGCNMMFSSRRSRNRHSANPNPKLHSPHLRRKISPHDGRSSQTHHLLIPPLPPSGLNPLAFGTFPLLGHTQDLRHQQAVMDLKQSLDLSLHRQNDLRKYDNSSSDHMDDYMMDDDDEDGIVVDGNGDDGYYLDSETQNGDKHDVERSKRLKLSESDVDMDDEVTSNMDSNEDSLSVVDSQSTKDDNPGENITTSSKSVRKRKNQNPTRCAVAQPLNDRDALTDEESSNDVFHGTKKEGMNVDEKERESPKNLTVEERHQTISETNNSEQMYIPENLSTSKEAAPRSQPENSGNREEESTKETINEEQSYEDQKLQSPSKLSDYQDKCNNDNNNIPIESLKQEKADEVTRCKSPILNKTDEQMDSSNALRQLENLSQGNFGDISLNRQHESFPLNFMIGHDPPSPARSQSSTGSSGDASEDNGDQIYGHFQDGTFISTMDVPIDKDNPRMCTACGKMFQNHFGVKTHYQNVHLKLMHKCTVDGCNAAFPSKRSRDRHSANLNLHRKLLSTSLTDKTGSLFLENSPFSSLAANTALHNELLSRFYGDPQSLPLGHPQFPPPGMMNGDRLPPHPPIFLPPLGGIPGFPGLNNFAHLTQPPQNINGHSSGSTSSTSPPSSPSPQDDDGPSPDRDGHSCRFCHQILQDPTALKDHYEQLHSSEMSRCNAPNCGQLFTSRRKRDAHSEAAHPHPPPPALTDT